MRHIPAVDQIKLRRPTHRVSSQHPNRCFKIGPVFGGGYGRFKGTEQLHRVAAIGHAIEKTRCRTRANARQQLCDAEPCDAIAKVLRPAQDGEYVLDVSSLEEFEPAEFHERNVAARKLDFETRTVMRGAE